MQVELDVQTKYFSLTRKKGETLVNIWKPVKEGKTIWFVKRWAGTNNGKM